MFIAVANTSGQATWSIQFVNISSAQNTLFQSKFFNKYHQMMFYEIVTNHFESAVLSQGFKLKKGNISFQKYQILGVTTAEYEIILISNRARYTYTRFLFSSPNNITLNNSESRIM